MPHLSLLMLVASEDDGGMARVVYLLARHLPAFDMTVRVAVHREAPLTRWLRDAAIPCDVIPELFEIPTRPRADGRTGLRALGANVRDMPRAVARVRALASRHQIDVLYSHHTWGHYLAASAAFGMRRGAAATPVVPVWHIHNDHSRLVTRLLDRTMARIGRVRAIAAVSHSTARPLLGAAPVTVVYNGIDVAAASMSAGHGPLLRARLGIDREAAVVAYTGRLVRHKGVDVLLDAARLAVPDVPNLHVVILGGTPRHAPDDVVGALRERVRAWGLDARIHLPGHIDPVERYLADADVAVVPSLCADGCPLAAIEALCLGIPVIGSRIGGIPEVVRHLVDGVLVPPGDARALAGAIVNLSRDRQRRGTMGRAAADAARPRFDAVEMSRRVAGVIRQAARMPAQGSEK